MVIQCFHSANIDYAKLEDSIVAVPQLQRHDQAFKQPWILVTVIVLISTMTGDPMSMTRSERRMNASTPLATAIKGRPPPFLALNMKVASSASFPRSSEVA
ncbi:hypothetical protein N7G274_000326 [Stereocaulon virgatum]|uniref:Uncharacterized protein n=1 Tax=Stereocaulon virgatum TaxID=373712 RepID=A0ABR4ASH3_9LECA